MPDPGPALAPAVWTIGHSRHTWERFRELLAAHEITLVADIRSVPMSRFSPHFHRERMRAALVGAGLGYEWMGQGLGGRPKGKEFYDDEGNVRHGRIAATPEFAASIARLRELAGAERVAMMCSEEDPQACHRRLLVAPALLAAGLAVLHIRKDTSLEREAERLNGV